MFHSVVMTISPAASPSPATSPSSSSSPSHPIGVENKKPLKKQSVPLSYRGRNNAEFALSGTVTGLGAVAAAASGNPSGIYPVYSRLMAWDSPKVISAIDKSVSGIDDGKRAFNIAPSLAHLGFVFSFLLSPFINKALREDVFPHNTPHDVRALRIVSPLVGIVTGVAGACAGRLIEKSLSDEKNNDRKTEMKKAINGQIAKDYNGLFDRFKSKAEKGKLKEADFTAFCTELLDEKNIEKMIHQAAEKADQAGVLKENQENQKGAPKEKTKLGLPRLNLQNLISTSLATGFVALGEMSDSVDGRKTGNTLMEIASMQRLVGFSLYKMFYEPIFVKKDRSFTKNFKTLESNQIRADMIATGTLGVSDKALNYALEHHMVNPKGGLNLEGHAMFASVAAAIGGFIEFFAMPRLVNLLDTDEKKIAASRKYLGNAVAEKIATIPDLDQKSPAEIKAILFSEENKELYLKAIERGLKAKEAKKPAVTKQAPVN